jgi:uncharacterized protein (DUF362 family)
MTSFVNIASLFNNPKLISAQDAVWPYSNGDILRESIRAVANDVIGDQQLIATKNVLMKPNWVLHNRKKSDEYCMRTNNEFLLAALELVLMQKPGKVIIGDAPVQGCSWKKMLGEDFLSAVRTLSLEYAIPVELRDFRRVTFDPSLNNPQRELRPLSSYVIFDLGAESFLEPISSDSHSFRVTCYNPDRLSESHRRGVHKYCIAKDLFEADLIISLPKVKTHQKAGITCALKNLVGVNGDKDYLPHHRVGGSGNGGDCYPGKNLLRRLAELLLDTANRRQGDSTFKLLTTLASAVWKLSFPRRVHQLDAGWYGNDTTWRMVMDLNRIVKFGTVDGTIANSEQRTLYSLCDGIVAGQGNGPLNPEPLPLGVISFTNDSGLNDLCMARLMGFDANKISLLKAAVAESNVNDFAIFWNGEKIALQDLDAHSVRALPPPGWDGYL